MNRKFKYLVLDVETANSTEQPLVYDIGFAICDRNGKIYEQKSYIVSDIFFDEKRIFNNSELMNTAYYKEKLPQYFKGLKNDLWQVKSFLAIRKEIKGLIKEYNIKAICAYNAHFDINALNTTLRYITKSSCKWYFDYDTPIFCIWHMACQTICNKNDYLKTAIENDWQSEKGNIQTNAEKVWAYLTKEYDFSESHTGLADVLIEVQIMAECFKYHKKINKKINRACWNIPQPKAKKLKAKSN